jgi:hypothetical protein
MKILEVFQMLGCEIGEVFEILENTEYIILNHRAKSVVGDLDSIHFFKRVLPKCFESFIELIYSVEN